MVCVIKLTGYNFCFRMFRKGSHYLVFVLLWGGFSAFLLGNEKEITLKNVSQPPCLDGSFEDECWREVEWIGGFVQAEPVRKAPPSERTEFKVLLCGSDLYFAVKCYDSHPQEIVALERRRDGGMWSDDTLEIRLDTYLDRRNYYSFRFNALGTQQDRKWGNLDWDGDWDVVAKVTDEGWVAEVRISLVPLAFPRRGEGYFGINFERRIRRLREEDLWSFTKDFPGRVDDFGLIGPIDFSKIPFNARLEMLLYGVGGFGADTNWHMGLDAHKFITPDFKYAFTLYPDYSDIEAVYESIDISYTERWLPDTRPFFSEGSEYFGAFYSRRIDKFDLGFKAFGKQGKNQLGFINCTRFSPLRNDIVFNFSHNPTYQSFIGATIQGRYEEDYKNFLIGGGGGFGSSDYNLNFSYASNFTDPGSNGFFYEGSLWRRLGERGGFFFRYSGISPDFYPALQLVGETGVKSSNIGMFYRKVLPRGEKWWENLRILVFYNRANYWSGGLKSESKGFGFSLGLRGDISVDFGRNITFYDPYRDNFTNFSLSMGAPEKRYSVGFSYGEGVRTNLPYKFASGWVGRQLMQDKLNLSLNMEKRWVGADSGNWSTTQQWWSSISYEIGKDFWMVLRIYGFKDTESHQNISAIIRRRGENKRNFYLVLGDPLGIDTKTRLVIKYVNPF